ncbi:MAG: homoserine kinase [Thermoproteota archaeon]|nr:homoserine kinase [Thermoproteota archaeon]
MKSNSITAVAPATSANLGSGFDVFSVALDIFFDTINVEMIEGGGIEIRVEGPGSASIPLDPDRNTAGIVAKALLSLSKRRHGLLIEIKKGIRPGSGLGSSAASAAAAVVAVNKLLNLNLSKLDLVRFAAQGEIASAGAAHADNVSAAILGQFNIIRCSNPLDVVNLSLPKNIGFAIVIPEITHKTTSQARSVLPEKVSLSDLVYHVGHAATIVAGIALGDVSLMGKGMSDIVVEPARAHLIPGLAAVKKSAMNCGAAGVSISGAGPSVIALVNTNERRISDVSRAMKEAFEDGGIKCEALSAKPGPGARLLEQ